MNIPLAYHGLTDAAMQQWRSASPDVAAPTLVRFLNARGREAADDPQALALLDVVRNALTQRPADEVDSGTLVLGSLVVHRLEGTWPIPAHRVQALVAQRWGRCRGGFDGYLRESATAVTVCNVDDSRAALELTSELGAA